MPIENELKFVLLETDAIEHLFIEHSDQVIKIEQKYLTIERGLSVRVRSSNCQGDYSYRLTVKKNVGGQVVEIETPISEDDFDRLWPTGMNKVVKIRYLYQGWEVDFFKDANSNYLAIAEIEMPPWQKSPTRIPRLIQDNVIFSVPIKDKRFSNKKLGNVQYATNLLNSIKRKNKGRLVERQIDKTYKKKLKSLNNLLRYVMFDSLFSSLPMMVEGESLTISRFIPPIIAVLFFVMIVWMLFVDYLDDRRIINKIRVMWSGLKMLPFFFSSDYNVLHSKFIAVDEEVLKLDPLHKLGWNKGTSIICRKKINSTIEVQISNMPETCYWYSFPCVKFYIGLHTGRIKKVFIRTDKIQNTGMWYRNGCAETDWGKMLSSIVQAHIEVLKYSKGIKNRNLSLVSRIFREHGDGIFAGVTK